MDATKVIETKRLRLELDDHQPSIKAYSIIRKLDKDKVGEITYFRDGQIVYIIYEPYRCAGYATEALKALTEYVPKDPKPYLRIRKTNAASQCVAHRSKYRKNDFYDFSKFDLWFYDDS